MPRFYGNFKLAFLPVVVVPRHLCCFAVPPCCCCSSLVPAWSPAGLGCRSARGSARGLGVRSWGWKNGFLLHQGWCQPAANAKVWPGCALVQGRMVVWVSEMKVELPSAFLRRAPHPENEQLKRKEEFRIWKVFPCIFSCFHYKKIFAGEQRIVGRQQCAACSCDIYRGWSNASNRWSGTWVRWAYLGPSHCTQAGMTPVWVGGHFWCWANRNCCGKGQLQSKGKYYLIFWIFGLWFFV